MSTSNAQTNVCFRYEIKDDTPIETKLEDKLIISETSTSLKASNKEEEGADAAEQNRLNEKQAQGMINNGILSNRLLLNADYLHFC